MGEGVLDPRPTTTPPYHHPDPYPPHVAFVTKLASEATCSSLKATHRCTLCASCGQHCRPQNHAAIGYHVIIHGVGALQMVGGGGGPDHPHPPWR